MLVLGLENKVNLFSNWDIVMRDVLHAIQIKVQIDCYFLIIYLFSYFISYIYMCLSIIRRTKSTF